MGFGSRKYSVGETPRFVFQMKTNRMTCAPTTPAEVDEIRYTITSYVRVMGNTASETPVAGHEDILVPLSAILPDMVNQPCLFDGSGQSPFPFNVDFRPDNTPPCFPNAGRYLLRLTIRTMGGQVTVCEPIPIEVV